MRITLRHRDSGTGWFDTKAFNELDAVKEIFNRCIEDDDTGWFCEVKKENESEFFKSKYTLIQTEYGIMACEIVR